MVANAGILNPAPFLEGVSLRRPSYLLQADIHIERLDDFNRVLTVNTSSVFLCYQHAGRRMIAEGHREGRIIGASSYVGKRREWSIYALDVEADLVHTAAPWLNSYGASKFAIRGLTQCAGELCRAPSLRFWFDMFLPAQALGPYGITVNAYAPGTWTIPSLLTQLNR